jgi:hypothetical protein
VALSAVITDQRIVEVIVMCSRNYGVVETYTRGKYQCNRTQPRQTRLNKLILMPEKIRWEKGYGRKEREEVGNDGQ